MRAALALIYTVIETSAVLALCGWAGLDAIESAPITILVVWGSAVAIIEMADRTYCLIARRWRYRHPGR